MVRCEGAADRDGEVEMDVVANDRLVVDGEAEALGPLDELLG